MHSTTILSSDGLGTELSRTVARLREQEMGFRVTHDDLAGLDQIARVSSRFGDASRWTELAVYYRPGENRPFVAVSEGHSVVPGEKLRFQYAAMGTLDRAMNWFEPSLLRDELAALMDRIELEWASLQDMKDKDMGLVDYVPPCDRTLSPPGAYMPAVRPERLSVPSPSKDVVKGPVSAFAGLNEALTWLYPGDDLSERARALAFERDFGMPERTIRNTLAIEAGRVEGKVGPWVQPMLIALRFMDRNAWEASRG